MKSFIKATTMSKCLMLVLLWSAATNLWAYCLVPKIRLDDEFFVSDIVFTGTIISDRKIGLTADGFYDGDLFKWRVERVFRGQVPIDREITTYSGSDSARFPQEAGAGHQVGRRFLIFAFRQDDHKGKYAVDNCGNSVPLSQAAAKLRDILDLPNHHGGLLYGSMMDGDAGVLITAQGNTGSFSTRTQSDGSFAMKVPPGKYSVTARKIDRDYDKTDIAYKDPKQVVVPDGGSAGLSFREQRR